MVMPPDPWTAFDTPLVVPNPGRVRYEKEKLSHPAVTLNQRQQDLVLQSVRETCKHRQWPLWAVHVRTNHAHVVLQSPQPPEKCLITLKAYATRCLRKNFQEKEWSQVWTRHGSTLPVEDRVGRKRNRLCHPPAGRPSQCLGKQGKIGNYSPSFSKIRAAHVSKRSVVRINTHRLLTCAALIKI
jgi:hypothetical protein